MKDCPETQVAWEKIELTEIYRNNIVYDSTRIERMIEDDKFITGK